MLYTGLLVACLYGCWAVGVDAAAFYRKDEGLKQRLGKCHEAVASLILRGLSSTSC
jgi:hypothetical protein